MSAMIARRYATALAAATTDTPEDLDTVATSLAAWFEAFTQSPELQKTLLQPVLAPNARVAIIRALLAKANDTPSLVANTLKLLAAKGRLSVLGDIVAALGALRDEQAGIVRGHVTAADTLSEKLRNRISNAIRDTSGKTPHLDWRNDPDLIAGFRAEFDHHVLDASLRHQLNRLQTTLAKGVK